MKIEKTNRGFAIMKFQDRNGVACSLQQSSLAEEDCIWLGCSDLLGCAGIITRMHLNRDQVRALLPHLQRFADTGELDAVEESGDQEE